MADVLTGIYKFVMPEVGGSDDTWGDKLNADFAALDGLLSSSGHAETGFANGTASDLGGTLRLGSTTPTLQWVETDATLPAGRYRMYASGGSFGFHANTAAAGDFTTTQALLTASASGITFGVPVLGTLAVEGSAPRIEFTENDQTKPAGQYRHIVSADLYSFQRALTADFATSTTIMSYGASVLTFPIDSVKIGAADATASVLTIQGTGSNNYIDNKATYLNFRDAASTQTARLDPLGTAAASAITIMTREKADSRYLNATGGVVSGDLVVAPSTTSQIRWKEVATTAAGIGVITYADSTNFYLMLTASGSADGTYNALRPFYIAKATGKVSMNCGASVGGNFDVSGTATFSGDLVSGGYGRLSLDGTSPYIWFHDSDGVAATRNFMISANNGNLRLSRSDDAGATVATMITGNEDTVWIHPNAVLASTGGTVDLGNSTSSTLNFSRNGINYIRFPSAGSFYLQTSDTSLTLLVANSSLFNTYADTNLAMTGGNVYVGNSATSILQFQRTGTGINYIKPISGTTLKVQTTAGGDWASISSGSGWQAGSDARLKDNIADIHYGLDTVLALRAVQFDWKDDGRHDIGLVAQEVQLVVPEVVSGMGAEEGEEEMLGLHKDSLVAVLIKAVQELAARVQTLEGAT